MLNDVRDGLKVPIQNRPELPTTKHVNCSEVFSSPNLVHVAENRDRNRLGPLSREVQFAVNLQEDLSCSELHFANNIFPIGLQPSLLTVSPIRVCENYLIIPSRDPRDN